MDPLRRFLTAVLLTVLGLGASVIPVLAGEVPPDVVIHGLVVVDDEAGDPMTIESATATVTYPGQPEEDVPVELSADAGEYTITLHGWTEPEAALLTVELIGAERRTPAPDSACELRVVDEASVDLELATPVATEVLTVATATVLDTICPSAEPSVPGATMPPTDGVADRALTTAGAPMGHAMLAILAALAVSALAAVGMRGFSRRGS